jgi:hypothetical protein
MKQGTQSTNIEEEVTRRIAAISLSCRSWSRGRSISRTAGDEIGHCRADADEKTPA